MNRARLKVLGSVLLATVFIVPFKIAASDGHGAGAALGLLILATLLFTPAALVRARGLTSDKRKKTWALAWRIGLAAAFGNITQGYAFEALHPGVAAVIIQMNVLFVAALGALWLKEAPSRELGFGIALTVLGLLVSQKTALFEHARLDPGVLAALGAALGFSMMDLLSRKGSSQVDSLLVNVERIGVGALILCAYPGAMAQLLSLDTSRLLALGIAALMGPGLARQLLISASRDLPAAESAWLQQLRPVLALPLGSIYFSSWPSAEQWLGSVVIICGLVLPGVLRRLRAREA